MVVNVLVLFNEVAIIEEVENGPVSCAFTVNGKLTVENTHGTTKKHTIRTTKKRKKHLIVAMCNLCSK